MPIIFLKKHFLKFSLLKRNLNFCSENWLHLFSSLWCILKILLHYPNYQQSYFIYYYKHILCWGVPRDTNTCNLFHEILFYKIRNHHYNVINPPKYRLRAIISRGIYYMYFLPHFSVWLIIKSG